MLPLFAGIYISKQVDQEDPQHVLFVRVCFFTIQACTLLAALYIKRCAAALEGTPAGDAEIDVPFPVPPFGSAPDPPSEKMSVAAYDAKKAKDFVRETLMSLGIMCLMHFKWGFVHPLVMTAVMGPMRVMENPLVKWYVMGQRGDDLARPFKAPPGFMDKIKEAQEQAQAGSDTSGNSSIAKDGAAAREALKGAAEKKDD
jgi:hypothetical protein